MTSSRLLSIVIPVYNEQDGLPLLYERLDRVLRGLTGWETEIIFIDDGSRDGSFAALRVLHEADPRVKIVKLSRNFGSWHAVIAGVRAAAGDAVMWLSSDLQDPPELIPRMAQRWEEGAQVVWAVRTERQDPWPRRISALLFYRLLRRIAIPDYPPLGMDICLMDRRVAELFGRLREHSRFTQGLIMSLGFKQVTVSYTREQRRTGRSAWGRLPRLLKMGIDMIVSFSYSPIRLMLYAGLLTAVVSAVFGIVLLVERFHFGAAIEGWRVLTWVVLILGALNLTMLGILGEYVWRVLEQVRERPLYVMEETVGFGPEHVPTNDAPRVLQG